MKNIRLVLFAVFASFTMMACNQQTKTDSTFKYSIALDVEGLRGPVILLDRTTHEPVQTIYSRSPEFKMEGELPIEKLHATFVLHFPSKYSNPYMYPVTEACAINFEMDKTTSIKAHYDSLLFANVQNEHMNRVEDFKKKNFPSIAEFEVFNMAGFKDAGGERRGEKEQIAYANKGNRLLANVEAEIKSKTVQFTDDEEMAVLLAEWGGQLGSGGLDSLSQMLNTNLHQAAAYKRILAVLDYMKKQQAPPSLKVGDKAPVFSLADEHGNVHNLADYKGKYVILDFWASWCGPCKREMPFMKELYHKYHTKGLEMVAISTDKERSAWMKAMHQLEMPYLQLHDKNGNVSDSYFVRGIPYVLLINPEGKIAGIKRGEELEALLKENLM